MPLVIPNTAIVGIVVKVHPDGEMYYWSSLMTPSQSGTTVKKVKRLAGRTFYIGRISGTGSKMSHTRWIDRALSRLRRMPKSTALALQANLVESVRI